MDVGILQPQRRAGACLHITSLPGYYGIGELGDNAKRFVLALESMGLTVWQILPIGPTGFGDSPYQLQSTFAGNELLIDIEELLRAGWLKDKEVKALRKLPADTVDFGQLIPLKQDVLQLAAERFVRSADAGQQLAYRNFVQQHDDSWLHDYALYRVLKRHHGERPWYEWASEYMKRDPHALATLESEQSVALANVKVLQFIFSQQWVQLRTYAGKHGVSLLGDMPFYIALDSADAWAHPELLMLNEESCPIQVAGVPPDYFSADGQLWGNPVYDWDYHAHQNYAWWIARLRHALSMTDQLRIDHFRGFEAYWAVSADAPTAREGHWLPGPREALFDAAQAALGKLPLVAEDLGVITPAVDALRMKYGFPGMKVLQFELADPEFDIDSIDRCNICYTGTHDNDTVIGWLTGSPEDLRPLDEIEQTRAAVLGRVGGGVESAHVKLLELALGSAVQTVIAPVQDLLGLDSAARLNTPGTAGGNWRWRLQPEMLTSQLCERIRDMVRETRRVSVSSRGNDNRSKK